MTEGLALVFGAFVGLLAGTMVVLLWRGLPARTAALYTLGLIAWLAYAGAVSGFGLLRDPALRPPGIVLVAVPAVAFAVLAIARGALGGQLAKALPLWLLIGLQVFRVGVEATLQALSEAGQVPRLMTLAGGNVEILVALAAPAAAWLSTRSAFGRRLAWGWNVLGLLSLLNVVLRGVLTSPGPLHLLQSDVPNLAIGQLPYSYIPALMVPCALVLHVLVFRAFKLKQGS